MSVLHVAVVECRDLASSDLNGFSDPFVTVTHVNTTTHETSAAIHKTLNPIFNFQCTFDADKHKDDRIAVHIRDRDSVVSSQLIGQCQLDVPQAQAAYAQWTTLTNVDGAVAQGKVLIVAVRDSDEPHDKTERIKRRCALFADAIKAYAPTTDNAAPLRIGILSFNIGNATPEADLAHVVSQVNDLIVVGLQESTYTVGPEFGGRVSAHISAIVTAHVGAEYHLVQHHKLDQIRLFVWAHSRCRHRIGSIRVAAEATGIGHVVGNKGGVAIRVLIDDHMVLSFITAHLAAHQDREHRRHSDVHEITAGLHLDPHNIDVNTLSHIVFFFGDLNYRLNYAEIGKQHTPTHQQFSEYLETIENEEYLKLIETDQLRAGMKDGLVLRGYTDSDTSTFAPTFKVERTSSTVYNPQRAPAYCDRILYRINNTAVSTCNLIKFISIPTVSTSDHKPIYGEYECNIIPLQPAIDYTRNNKHLTFILSHLRLEQIRVMGELTQINQMIVGHLRPILKFQSEAMTKPVWSSHQCAVVNEQETLKLAQLHHGDGSIHYHDLHSLTAMSRAVTTQSAAMFTSMTNLFRQPQLRLASVSKSATSSPSSASSTPPRVASPAPVAEATKHAAATVIYNSLDWPNTAVDNVHLTLNVNQLQRIAQTHIVIKLCDYQAAKQIVLAQTALYLSNYQHIVSAALLSHSSSTTQQHRGDTDDTHNNNDYAAVKLELQQGGIVCGILEAKLQAVWTEL